MYMAAPENVSKQEFVKMLNIKAIPESEDAIKRREEAKQYREKQVQKI